MSIIASVLLAGANAPATSPAPARSPVRSAEAVMEAYRAKASIGPDPCRSPDPDEIVVCARDRNEFATPLYDTDIDDDSKFGGNRAGQMQAIRDATSSCKSQGHGCEGSKGSINVFAVAEFVVGGIRALLGKDD